MPNVTVRGVSLKEARQSPATPDKKLNSKIANGRLVPLTGLLG
ncbi:hypothetical protein [Methylovulum sp.]|nr:hypothetical protein [Methylovulum sp.]MDD5125382.1 hypothetical protein [Methylovulum sp.]